MVFGNYGFNMTQLLSIIDKHNINLFQLYQLVNRGILTCTNGCQQSILPGAGGNWSLVPPLRRATTNAYFAM